MEILKSLLKKLRFDSLLFAIVAIALGVIICAYPLGMLKIVCILLGIVLFLSAIVEVFGFFVDPIDYSLAQGIGLFVIAIWLFTMPVAILNGIINVVFAVLVIINASQILQGAIQGARIHVKNWWILLLAGLITLGLGIAIFFIPQSHSLYIGISLIVDGLCAIIKVSYFDARIRKANKEVIDI